MVCAGEKGRWRYLGGMIISPGRKFIFVHIPKTGGTSLALALEGRAHRDDILIGDTPKAVKRRGRVKALREKAAGRLWKHSTLADLQGAVGATGMFCFTLVRNPWDRAVSYYHWLRGQGFDHRAVGLAKTLGFSDFLRHPHTVDTLSGWPYGRYLQDASGQEHSALFIRLEHLEQDAAPLWDHLGFTLEIPHENRSERSGYRDYYDADLAAHLGQVCAEDIARFGYQF